MTLTYLIGKQYREGKNSHGGDRKSNRQNGGLNETAEIVAKQNNSSYRTVERAAVFSENLEKICENAGIKRQEILLHSVKMYSERD